VTLSQPTPATLQRGPVLLRPLEPGDYPSLRRVELSGKVVANWRHAGAHPPPESYATSLWDGVYAHFLCFSTERSLGLGLATIYEHDPVNRVAAFAAIRFEDDLRSRTEFLTGTYLAMNYAFQIASVRKLYMETPSYNYEHLRSLVKRGVLLEEGRLSEHKLQDGRYWDQHILAVTPASCEKLGELIALVENGTRRDPVV